MIVTPLRRKSDPTVPLAVPRFPPDYALAVEPVSDHLRNSTMMLGVLRHLIEQRMEPPAVPECIAFIEAISARLDKALAQVEGR